MRSWGRLGFLQVYMVSVDPARTGIMMRTFSTGVWEACSVLEDSGFGSGFWKSGYQSSIVKYSGISTVVIVAMFLNTLWT